MATYPLAALTVSLLRFDVAGTIGTASTAGKAGTAKTNHIDAIFCYF